MAYVRCAWMLCILLSVHCTVHVALPLWFHIRIRWCMRQLYAQFINNARERAIYSTRDILFSFISMLFPWKIRIHRNARTHKYTPAHASYSTSMFENLYHIYHIYIIICKQSTIRTAHYTFSITNVCTQKCMCHELGMGACVRRHTTTIFRATQFSLYYALVVCCHCC